LDDGNTSHLDRSLKRNGYEQATEARPVGKQLCVGFGFVLLLKRDSILDRFKFGNDPGVLGVAMCVEVGQSLETLFSVSVG
jgi:hypothetical protein